jgi:hypothetical protein
LLTLIKAQKEEKEDATVKVLQFLRDSPFIGGFQVEVVYADKSTARKGEGCYRKSPAHLANSPFIGEFKLEIVYADKSTERKKENASAKVLQI